MGKLITGIFAAKILIILAALGSLLLVGMLLVGIIFAPLYAILNFFGIIDDPGELDLNTNIPVIQEDKGPDQYVEVYKEASRIYHVPWELLAAIHKHETDFGRDISADSEGGKIGPMQVNATLWVGFPYAEDEDKDKTVDYMNPEVYTNKELIEKGRGMGVDVDDDGKADPTNPADAIFGAANILLRFGASQIENPAEGEDPDGVLRRVVSNYHPGDEQFVNDVIETYKKYKNGELGELAPPEDENEDSTTNGENEDSGTNTGGGGGELVEPPDGSGTVVTAPPGIQNETIIIKAGEVFDGKNQRFIAGSDLGDGSQSENQNPIFRLEKGAKLINVVLGAPAADGIHVYGDNYLANVHWEDIGEDALTVKGSGTIVIDGGSAKNGDDKVFQINEPSTFKVSNFKADSAGKFIRQNGGTTFKVEVEITNSDISNMKESIFRTDSSISTVRMTDTRYHNVPQVFRGVNPNNITTSNNTEY